MIESGNNDDVQVHDLTATVMPEELSALTDPIPVAADEMPAQPDPIPVGGEEMSALTDPIAVGGDEMPAHTEENSEPADDLRARMMRQFEQWLDGMLAGETAPPVPRELIEEALGDSSSADASSSGADLYTLFAALTKLTGEIGLQGRAFKQLNDVLAPVTELPGAIRELEDAQHASGRELDRIATQLETDPSADSSESSLPASKDVLGVLFDLVERLERGLKTFESGITSIKANTPVGFLARMSGAERQASRILETVQAMHEGYRLTAARLEAAIQQWGIQRMGRVGDMFDPTTMTAIELDTTSGRPSGTIVEVYRGGYRLHGEMLSTTQVKVAK